MTRRPDDWTQEALCAQIGGDLWHPEKGENPHRAVAICRTCPVRAECLDYALANSERFGIWGGLSERKRRPLHDLYSPPDLKEPAA